MGMRAMMEDLGTTGRLKIYTDASAAQGICGRKGLGAVRHIEVHQLWVQDKVRDGEFVVEQIVGKKNFADYITKYNDRSDQENHCKIVTIKRGEDRFEVIKDEDEELHA